MQHDSTKSESASYVKGVFMSKFDLSFGPVPVAKYPQDFITEEQSKGIAMLSMLQLNASKGKTTTTIATSEEIGALGIGLLGRLPSVGFFSLIIFFDVAVPRGISDNIDEVINLISEFGSKFDNNTNVDSFAKEVFVEAQKLVSRSAEQPNVLEQPASKELDDTIRNLGNQIMLVLEEYRKMRVPPHEIFLSNATELVGNLSLLATKLDTANALSGLAALLMETETT